MIRIDDRLSIPPDELTFVASRGGGPGGQNVNKVASRLTLRFDVEGSQSLDDAQRARIREALSHRINREGILHLSSHSHRSQAANRAQLEARFARLLAGALKREKPRKKTRPSRSAKRRRLESKRRRSELKRTRGRVRRREE